MGETDPRYDYCKVLVRGQADRDAIQDTVALLLGGVPQPFHSVRAEDIQVDIRRNDDDDPSRPGDLHFWPVYLDIERRPGATDDSVRSAISRLLEGLWRGDIEAVPACKFEDELPKPGRPL